MIRTALPGFGLTGPSPDGDYRLPACARFIVQLMDRLNLPAQAQFLARDIAGNRLQVFEDLGQVPHEEDPMRTVAAVRAFLDP